MDYKHNTAPDYILDDGDMWSRAYTVAQQHGIDCKPYESQSWQDWIRHVLQEHFGVKYVGYEGTMDKFKIIDSQKYFMAKLRYGF